METFQGQKPAKVEKAAKATKGMFQSLIGASMGPVGAILKLITSLKPFMAIIKIVEGLFKALLGEAMKPLMEALKPVFDILISLMPVFRTIGKLIGTLLAVGLIPLRVALKLLEPILTPLLPYIDDFAYWLDQVLLFIDPLIDIIELGLIVAIKWLGDVIEDVIKWFKKLGSAIGDWWEDLWSGDRWWEGPGATPVDPLGGLGWFQYGTDYVPHTGPYILHEGEKVSTAYESREMIGLLQEISTSNRRILRDKEFRHR